MKNLHIRQKILDEYISWPDPEQFFTYIWSIDRLQSGRPEHAREYIEYPPEAATQDISSKYAVRKWELETLLNIFLLNLNQSRKTRIINTLRTFDFASIARIITELREIENDEAGVLGHQEDVLLELHRIAQRQFPWQQGFGNVASITRYLKVYGQGAPGEYFKTQYGITPHRFFFCCFAFQSYFEKKPELYFPNSFRKIGISSDEIYKTLSLCCETPSGVGLEARYAHNTITKKFGYPPRVAYKPSTVRRYPIFACGRSKKRLFAPLPELIVQRATSGLFYDVVEGGRKIQSQVGKNFEAYALRVFSHYLRNTEVGGDFEYYVGRNRQDSTDIIVSDEGAQRLFVECKARRPSYSAQFGVNPREEAASAFQELAKGIFQIWRYRSHERRGFVRITDRWLEEKGMILTLDTWFWASPGLVSDILKTANRLADQDGYIDNEDRCDVIFCGIDEIERVLSQSSFPELINCINESTSGDFFWLGHRANLL